MPRKSAYAQYCVGLDCILEHTKMTCLYIHVYITTTFLISNEFRYGMVWNRLVWLVHYSLIFVRGSYIQSKTPYAIHHIRTYTLTHNIDSA